MRLSDKCRIDECEKRIEPGHSFIVDGTARYDFCSAEHAMRKLEELKRREPARRQ